MINRNIEKWKYIKDYPKYQISCFGRVIGAYGYILNPSIDKDGYLYFTAFSRVENKKKKRMVHLMVIKHFGPTRPSNKYQCNHKDGVKTNNWWTNLEWMTNQENIKHAVDNGLLKFKGEDNPKAKLTKEKVIMIRDLRKQDIPCIDIANAFNVSKSTIYRIINKTYWNDV